jgi:hypothetical protein
LTIGSVENQDLIMMIKENLTEQMKKYTLICLIYQAIYDFYKLNENDDEEKIVDNFTTAMIMLFKDNKYFKKILDLKLIKIGCFEYKIIEIDGNIDESDCSISGRICNESLTIKIKKDLPYWQKLRCLLHEINHSIYQFFELEKGDNLLRITEAFAKGTIMFFEDNAFLNKILKDK